MKTFIYRLSLFVVSTSLLYVLVVFLWGITPSILVSNINFLRGEYGHLYSRINEIKKYKNVDILFLGASRVYRGFDPRIFSKEGYKTFNLGSSSQTPIQTKLLLNRYLNDINPKTVIYSVSPDMFMSDGVEASLDLISNDQNDWNTFQLFLKTRNIGVFNTFLYASLREQFKLNEGFEEPIKKQEDTYVSGGFVERELDFYTIKPLPQVTFDVKYEYQKTAFQDIINHLKSKGIRVVLVFVPIPKNNYNRYTNIAAFDTLMSSYSEFFDFNKRVNLNDSLHFYDANHLNQKGVELYNQEMLNVLSESL